MRQKLRKMEKHGIGTPVWMWAMIEKARLRKSKASKTAWLWGAIIAQAKRDGVYDEYDLMLRNKEG